MTDAPPRPLPAVNDDNRAFWTSGAGGKLMISRCERCRYYVHPPVAFCPKCDGRSVTPEPVSGRGRIYSYTINRKAWLPALPVPYVLALIELEEQEGLRIPANIIDCDPEDVTIDMKVSVRFEAAEELFVPLFGPIS